MLIGTVVLLIGVVHAAGGLSNAVDTLQNHRSATGYATRR